MEREEKGMIEVFGARVHNLKNVDVEIPHDSLTVITGLSGSGKSSLAFDTIFAEGQRRYLETFSAYARNFLGGMERPDVDKITGLSPVISIEQKTTNKNPRSTVGTTTEIYDYLRLLYSRAADAYSYLSGEKMVKYTEEKILELLLNAYDGKRIYILAPLVKNRKGHYKELFEQMMRKGYLNVRIDGRSYPSRTVGINVVVKRQPTANATSVVIHICKRFKNFFLCESRIEGSNSPSILKLIAEALTRVASYLGAKLYLLLEPVVGKAIYLLAGGVHADAGGRLALAVKQSLIVSLDLAVGKELFADISGNAHLGGVTDEDIYALFLACGKGDIVLHSTAHLLASGKVVGKLFALYSLGSNYRAVLTEEAAARGLKRGGLNA